jgi:hypothetical protein
MTDFESAHEPQPVNHEALNQALGTIGLEADVLTVLPVPAEDTMLELVHDQAGKKEKEIDTWLGEVEGIAADQSRARGREEGRLSADIQAGVVSTREEATERVAKIDEVVAQAAHRTYTFNRSHDPKYNRTQSYVASVDAQGNIWGDFKEARNAHDVTGQPYAAGKHMIRKNPTL